MNKWIIAALSLTLLTTGAPAQDTPVADVAVGYSALEVSIDKGSNFTAHGGSGSVALNANKWLAGAGDFALYHASPIASGLAAGTYTFGPRFSYRHWERFTPFAQALFGGVRYANNGLAFSAGGGADISLDRGARFALRPQVEYFGFRTNGGTVHTARLSFGFVFRVGKK